MCVFYSASCFTETCKLPHLQWLARSFVMSLESVQRPFYELRDVAQPVSRTAFNPNFTFPPFFKLIQPCELWVSELKGLPSTIPKHELPPLSVAEWHPVKFQLLWRPRLNFWLISLFGQKQYIHHPVFSWGEKILVPWPGRIRSIVDRPASASADFWAVSFLWHCQWMPFHSASPGPVWASTLSAVQDRLNKGSYAVCNANTTHLYTCSMTFLKFNSALKKDWGM